MVLVVNIHLLSCITVILVFAAGINFVREPLNGAPRLHLHHDQACAIERGHQFLHAHSKGHRQIVSTEVLELVTKSNHYNPRIYSAANSIEEAGHVPEQAW